MPNSMSPLDRRINFRLRNVVDAAILVGRRQGFVEAADFMFNEHIPNCVAIRLLAKVATSHPS